MNLFIKGYVKARGIDARAIIIVKKLKFIRTKKASKQRIKAYKIPVLTEIFPEAIGLFLVLLTFQLKRS